ncbi:MAG: carboxypeptidase-like regulatory domain-containing protein [Rhodothermales bacterium]
MLPLLLLGLALSMLPPDLRAQSPPRAELRGTVIDAESGLPLVGAHVFIAGSMAGTVTDRQGRYMLSGLPAGAHRLYVSMLGYQPDFRDILIRSVQVLTFDFELSEVVLDAGEIVVEAERDDKWLSRLERFTRAFIGETPNAQQTTIVNPEVLDFEEHRGTFRATAQAPIIIENLALGYRIQYFLSDFAITPTRVQYDGEPLFEQMQTDNPEQARLWDENRRVAFMGSFRHFALALLAGRVEAQGFKTWSRPTAGGQGIQGDTRFPLDPASLITPGDSPGEYHLHFEGAVEIAFMGEMEHPEYLSQGNPGARDGRRRPSFQTSWLTMEDGPTVMDYKGDILNPYGITFRGYLAWQRVADEVPREYRPGS